MFKRVLFLALMSNIIGIASVVMATPQLRLIEKVLQLDPYASSTQLRETVVLPQLGSIRFIFPRVEYSQGEGICNNEIVLYGTGFRSRVIRGVTDEGRIRATLTVSFGSRCPPQGLLHLAVPGGRHSSSYTFEVSSDKIVYRRKPSSTFLRYKHLHCATAEGDTEHVHQTAAVTTQQTATLLTPIFKMYLAADPLFYTRYGRRTAAALRSIAAQTDRLYRSSIGIRFKIAVGPRLTRQALPVRQSDPDRLLGLTRRYVVGSVSRTHDLYTIFTRRVMDEGTQGISYVATVCRDRGNAVSLIAHANLTLSTIVHAHEVGHLFNARHVKDAEGNLVEGEIMSAYLTEPYATRFDRRTVASIRGHVRRHGGQCR